MKEELKALLDDYYGKCRSDEHKEEIISFIEGYDTLLLHILKKNTEENAVVVVGNHSLGELYDNFTKLLHGMNTLTKPRKSDYTDIPDKDELADMNASFSKALADEVDAISTEPLLDGLPEDKTLEQSYPKEDRHYYYHGPRTFISIEKHEVIKEGAMMSQPGCIPRILTKKTDSGYIGHRGVELETVCNFFNPVNIKDMKPEEGVKEYWHCYGQTYRKLGRDEVIRKGACMSWNGSKLTPIFHQDDGETIGKTPSDFNDMRDFYNQVY